MSKQPRMPRGNANTKHDTPKVIADKLRVYGWKEYAGEDQKLLGFWAKQDMAIKVNATKSLAKMYHVSLITHTKEVNLFINQTELEALIERNDK